MNSTNTKNPEGVAGIKNQLHRSENGVWILHGHAEFAYSDGADSEHYLRKVLNKATDLSSGSEELQAYIRDWPSEYHLTNKRAQLLAHLPLNKNSRVLEIGCGCGAITRFLGETFKEVVSIEGSIKRAEIARLRTRDLPNISVVASPFQEIVFDLPFDIIFCIGVLEYSHSFVQAEDPCAAVLERLASSLSPTGHLVLAIENQFGLKYFCGATEDHTNRLFEGIEGYPYHYNDVRTFGRHELHERLKRNFKTTKFYYPYPDYKIPSCVLSEEAMQLPGISRLISGYESRDYSGIATRFGSERRILPELERNNQLEFFSNSFLAVASRADPPSHVDGGIGFIYTKNRRRPFHAVTSIIREGGQVLVKKRPVNDGVGDPESGVRIKSFASEWYVGESVADAFRLRLRSKQTTLSDALEPVRKWLVKLTAAERAAGGSLPGWYIDAIWQNAVITPAGCQLVDLEWDCGRILSTKGVLIRAAYYFMIEMYENEAPPVALPSHSVQMAIRRIGNELGIVVTSEDLAAFVRDEAMFQHACTGKPAVSFRTLIQVALASRRLHDIVRSVARFRKQFLRQSARVIGKTRRVSARLLATMRRSD